LSQILKHKELPIYKTDEFNFYRCVTFDESLYGKTVSSLHGGNLRKNGGKGRHSKLFPGENISYWAGDVDTSRAEVKKHNNSNNLFTFWAYDDATSTFPTIATREPLIIVDGRSFRFEDILNKIENDSKLSFDEQRMIEKISEEKPDCLVYRSHAKKNGVNFLFFEKGFAKLSLREVRLRLGDKQGKNNNSIVCAVTSDYSPIVENYGCYFEPLTRLKMSEEYLKSTEYISRNMEYENSLERVREFYRSKSMGK
jgi:hypothetical protein